MDFKSDIQKSIAVLKTGGIILYPTDTIWGIGCDATNGLAVAKIYTLKQRSEKKSMIILLADEKEIRHYCKAPSAAIKKIINDSEKPVTIIYPDAKNLACNLINEDGSIAIRIVKDEFCTALIKTFGKPVVSTSANISGEISPGDFEEISSEIKSGVDFIAEHRRQDKKNQQPSRILKWQDDDELITIRD